MDITAGTLHPKPRSNGIIPLPGKPNFFIFSFIIYVTLDMYPLSSSIAIIKKSTNKLGIKTKTLPIPEIIPSITNDLKKKFTSNFSK
ncbi:hypothetical protein D3C87_1608430 [compost metagenome]